MNVLEIKTKIIKNVSILRLSNHAEIFLTNCWFIPSNKDWVYNNIHNYITIAFNGFFINVKTRKHRNYPCGFFKDMALLREVERARKTADKIIKKFRIQ